EGKSLGPGPYIRAYLAGAGVGKWLAENGGGRPRRRSPPETPSVAIPPWARGQAAAPRRPRHARPRARGPRAARRRGPRAGTCPAVTLATRTPGTKRFWGYEGGGENCPSCTW